MLPRFGIHQILPRQWRDRLSSSFSKAFHSRLSFSTPWKQSAGARIVPPRRITTSQSVIDCWPNLFRNIRASRISSYASTLGGICLCLIAWTAFRNRSQLTHTVFFDGSFNPSSGVAGMAAVVQNAKQQQISAVSIAMPDQKDSTQSEHNALLLALKAALDAGAKVLVVKGDSASVLNQMKGCCKITKDLKEQYAEAKKLESMFKRVTYEHISRAYNTTAHKLANLSRKEMER